MVGLNLFMVCPYCISSSYCRLVLILSFKFFHVKLNVVETSAPPTEHACRVGGATCCAFAWEAQHVAKQCVESDNAVEVARLSRASYTSHLLQLVQSFTHMFTSQQSATTSP